MVMSAKMSVLILSLFFILLFQGHNHCSGEAANITGFIGEPLDLVCIKQRDNKDMIVERHLGKPKFVKFISSKWNPTNSNYNTTCARTKDPLLYNLCSSQVTSYVAANKTHFVIKSTPQFLNGYQTRCEYSGTLGNGPNQNIKLQGIVRGYVDGRIQMNCSIPKNRCSNSRVSLKFGNETNVQRVNVTSKDHKFVCVTDRNYYKLCQTQMHSSYVNGTSVIFVIEKTPAYLNNIHLFCHFRFDFSCPNYQPPIETIIFLKNNGTASNPTTLPITIMPPPHEKKKETTTTNPVTAQNTTTSTNATTTPTSATTTPPAKLPIWVIPVVVSIVVVFAVLAVIYCCYRNRNNQQNCRNDQRPNNDDEGL